MTPPRIKNRLNLGSRSPLAAAIGGGGGAEDAIGDLGSAPPVGDLGAEEMGEGMGEDLLSEGAGGSKEYQQAYQVASTLSDEDKQRLCDTLQSELEVPDTAAAPPETVDTSSY